MSITRGFQFAHGRGQCLVQHLGRLAIQALAAGTVARGVRRDSGLRRRLGTCRPERALHEQADADHTHGGPPTQHAGTELACRRARQGLEAGQAMEGHAG
jgi:hypothetical protein